MASEFGTAERHVEEKQNRWNRVKGWCSRWWQRVHRGQAGRRGAAPGIVLATGIVADVSAAALYPRLGVFDRTPRGSSSWTKPPLVVPGTTILQINR